ncbi:MAG TPA: hypothetical protein VM553_01370 [Dongiaceae bacterium]|nr:hypothetical protein [Dongiaceae bacterium]
MKDPYQAPQSDLVSGDLGNPSKKLWKAFFWFLLVLEVLSVWSMVEDAEPLIDMLLDVAIYTFVLLALYGYSYNKPLLTRSVWKLLIPIALAYDIYSLTELDIDDVESKAEMIFLVVFCVVVIGPITVLQYMGLFRYAYRADEIWRR